MGCTQSPMAQKTHLYVDFVGADIYAKPLKQALTPPPSSFFQSLQVFRKKKMNFLSANHCGNVWTWYTNPCFANSTLKICWVSWTNYKWNFIQVKFISINTKNIGSHIIKKGIWLKICLCFILNVQECLWRVKYSTRCRLWLSSSDCKFSSNCIWFVNSFG
jgi:hypothetical protein